MANQELVKFFKSNINNHTIAEIKASLLKQGWSERDVDDAAESALYDEDGLNDLLKVGKEDLIPGTVQDLKKNMPVNEGNNTSQVSPLKLFLFIGVGIGVVLILGIGSYVLSIGDKEVIAEKIIDSNPVNSASEAVILMKNMFSDFKGGLDNVKDMKTTWQVCYDSTQVQTCCSIQKDNGATNCETNVL
jgi:hypothetical protein